MNALQQLADFDLQERRQRYPTMPEYAIPRTRFSDTTSNGLIRAILRWLELHGCWASRINTQGRYIQGHQVEDVVGRRRQLPGRWVKGTTRRGTADIHAVIAGRHVSIEVKVGKDRMSDAQHKTKKAIEACGGVYYIARDFESFAEWYSHFINTISQQS